MKVFYKHESRVFWWILWYGLGEHSFIIAFEPTSDHLEMLLVRHEVNDFTKDKKYHIAGPEMIHLLMKHIFEVKSILVMDSVEKSEPHWGVFDG